LIGLLRGFFFLACEARQQGERDETWKN